MGKHALQVHTRVRPRILYHYIIIIIIIIIII